MLIVLSPAKSLDFESESVTEISTIPDNIADSEKIIAKLRKLNPKKIGALMGISANLSDLNYERFQNWSTNFDVNTKQAVLAFTGDVYKGLEASDFTPKEFEFTQDHVRLLSGLHGMLRPLDLIHPYRLEMGTKLPLSAKTKNLYEFWTKKVTKNVNEILKNSSQPVLVNLASNEYFKVINSKEIKGSIVTPSFKEERNGQLKIISFLAKKARGLMTRYAVKNQITNPEDLKGFDLEDYKFEPSLSDTNSWTFIR